MTAPDSRKGGVAAFAAYAIWGLFPLYFKALADVPALEVLSHRIAWSAVLTLVLVLVMGKGEELVATFRHRKRFLGLAGSAICISINWGFYIWAVGNGHALDASLGYFIYPLCSVLLGALLLGERLSRRQTAAIGVVCIGVTILAVDRGGVPWLVLVFPLSFGFYGLLRKVVPVDALTGLTVETLLLSPFALGLLLTRPAGGALLAGDSTITSLLIAAGPVTTLPLVLFAYGARRLKLSTLGLLQYLNPTVQMAIAVLVFGEAFTRTHALTFVCIWSGLILYSLPMPRALAR